MKYFNLSFLFFCLLTLSHAQDNKATHLRTARNYGHDERHLSVWASFLNFLRCPPGPLGFNCDSDDSGGGGGGGGSSSSSNSYWSSSSSKNEASDSGSSANESDGTSNKWYGGSGNSAEKSGISGAVWMMIIGGIAIVSTAAAYIAHRTSKNEEVGVITANVDAPKSSPTSPAMAAMTACSGAAAMSAVGGGESSSPATAVPAAGAAPAAAATVIPPKRSISMKKKIMKGLGRRKTTISTEALTE